MSLAKTKRLESRAFLSFAHEQYGPCCMCKERPWAELHHYGAKGMGQRCDDYEVARVCHECHENVQGKRAAYFARTGLYSMLSAMQTDNIELLKAWAANLEARKERR